jgi:hypothetical protein
LLRAFLLGWTDRSRNLLEQQCSAAHERLDGFIGVVLYELWRPVGGWTAVPEGGAVQAGD